jgi:hypothetical protein
MEEEADLDVLIGVTKFFSEHCGEKHQMVVVNPYHVAVLDVFGNSFGKQSICFSVRTPCRFVKCYFAGMVVEERPKD